MEIDFRGYDPYEAILLLVCAVLHAHRDSYGSEVDWVVLPLALYRCGVECLLMAAKTLVSPGENILKFPEE